jgi:hypothetical protein
VIADLCDYRHKTPPPGESLAVKAAQRKPKPTPLV